MARAYSIDLRQRIQRDCEAGMRTGAVAAKYTVSSAFVRKLNQRYRHTGQLEAKPHGGGRKRKLAGHAERLRALVAAQPDATLAELRERLGVVMPCSTLWYELERLGLSVKKNSVRRRAAAP